MKLRCVQVEKTPCHASSSSAEHNFKTSRCTPPHPHDAHLLSAPQSTRTAQNSLPLRHATSNRMAIDKSTSDLIDKKVAEKLKEALEAQHIDSKKVIKEEVLAVTGEALKEIHGRVSNVEKRCELNERSIRAHEFVVFSKRGESLFTLLHFFVFHAFLFSPLIQDRFLALDSSRRSSRSSSASRPSRECSSCEPTRSEWSPLSSASPMRWCSS